MLVLLYSSAPDALLHSPFVRSSSVSSLFTSFAPSVFPLFSTSSSENSLSEPPPHFLLPSHLAAPRHASVSVHMCVYSSLSSLASESAVRASRPRPVLLRVIGFEALAMQHTGTVYTAEALEQEHRQVWSLTWVKSARPLMCCYKVTLLCLHFTAPKVYNSSAQSQLCY